MKAVSFTVPGICGQGLHFQINGFSLVYLCIAVLMWVVSGIFSLEYMAHYERRKRYYWFFWECYCQQRLVLQLAAVL